MDQGNEAVHAREIWYRHQLVLTGPETSISGFFNGPIWHWFVTLGYVLFAGAPIGPVILLIFLNLALTALVMWQIYRMISFWLAILVGLALQFFWPFFDTSRYAFSPFALVFCAFLAMLLLCRTLEGKRKNFVIAGVPISLAFHTELASFPPLLFLYVLIGAWSLFKKRLGWTAILGGLSVIFIFLVPHILSEVTTGFSQTLAIQKHLISEHAVFGQTSFSRMYQVFTTLIGETVIPQKPILGAVIFFIIFVMFVKLKKNNFVKHFVFLSLLLTGLSWAWFSSSTGWHSWHTVYIGPLLFIALLLMLFSVPRKVGVITLSIMLVFQLSFFAERYKEILRPTDDASLLTNELAAIDWTYQKSAGQGFYVYTYLPSVYDYPYQYLFWWHGRKTYGYVPCEYSTHPNIPDLFVPGLKYYQEPKRECGKFRFLIIEPYINKVLQEQWLSGARKGTELTEETNVGSILLEKRIEISNEN